MALAAVLSISSTSVGAADGEVIDHPSVVPTKPEKDYPIILDTPTFTIFNPGLCDDGCVQHRQTFAVNLSGRYLVSGGDFLNVELADGSVISHPYLAIFDTTTKELVCQDLEVDDEVLTVIPGPDPESILIGGRFRKITGPDGVERGRNRLAKIDIATCSVDRVWIAGPINSRVDEMTVSGNRLFIGGSFTSVDGQPIEKLAELDYQTGTVDTDFSFNWGGTYSPISGIGVSPDGTRLGVVHSSDVINGLPRRATAVIDISDPSDPVLTAHQADTTSKAAVRNYDITDGSIAADFSVFAIAQGTTTESDYVSVIPTADAPNQFTWEHFMRDSSFGIAVSNNAVYVGGHFCKIDEGPGPTTIGAPISGPDECTGSGIAGGAWRTQLAALSLVDGTPLDWNPGNNAFRGASALTVVPRGLLVGYDGLRTNDLRIGTTAFFDFGPPEPPPAQTCTATAAGVGAITLVWDEIVGENRYIVRRNNSWLATATDTLTFTDNAAPVDAEYVIKSTLAGVTTNTTCELDGDPPPPPPEQTCVVVENGDGTATLVWDEIVGENRYIIRRNDAWLATVTDTLTFTDNAAPVGAEYVIKSSLGGVTTNTTCT